MSCAQLYVYVVVHHNNGLEYCPNYEFCAVFGDAEQAAKYVTRCSEADRDPYIILQRVIDTPSHMLDPALPRVVT